MKSFLGYLRKVKEKCDKRQKGKIEHDLDKILFIVCIGIICGRKSMRSIRSFAFYKKKELSKYIDCSKIPSLATISRCLNLVDKKSLDKLLSYEYRDSFTKELEDLGIKEHIAVDGKFIRANKKENEDGLNIVTALNVTTNRIEGQIVVGSKTNEKTATPELLKTLNLKDKIVTGDSINTHKKFIDVVLNGGGYYLLPVKANTSILHTGMIDYFNLSILKDECEHLHILKKEHGRKEVYDFYMTTNCNWINDFTKFRGIKTICYIKKKSSYIKKKVSKKKKKTKDTESCDRYFIASFTDTAENMFNYITEHWKVETMHFYLDVSFREDKCNATNKNVSVNLNIIRKLALNIAQHYQKKYHITDCSVETISSNFALDLDICFEEIENMKFTFPDI